MRYLFCSTKAVIVYKDAILLFDGNAMSSLCTLPESSSEELLQSFESLESLYTSAPGNM